MAVKLAHYARRAGVDDVALIMTAYRLALKPRLEHLSDVFHHDMLHPARTALILLEQAGIRDSTLLAAAELTETSETELQLPVTELRAVFSDRVVALREAVPVPAAEPESLLERLVTAEPAAALIAVAERLDHARHLHFRKPAIWQPFFDEAITVYLPVAERVSEPLARRFERWAYGFRRRLP